MASTGVGRRCAAKVCRQAGVCRSGMRHQGAPHRYCDSTPRRDDRPAQFGVPISSSARSTGAPRVAQVPNPRFDAQKWRQLNAGNLANWDGFRKQMIKATGIPRERVSKPPMLRTNRHSDRYRLRLVTHRIRPAQSPRDRASEVGRTSGLGLSTSIQHVGVLGSGMPKTSIEWQMFHPCAPVVTDNTLGDLHDQVKQSRNDESIINWPAPAFTARSLPSGARPTPAR